MKVLYVTRKYPPTVGGMETAAYELHYALQDMATTRLIKYGGPNKYLPLVYPVLFLRALFNAWIYRLDIIYLQDGMLAPMGVVLRALTRKPCVMSVHGLDVTFRNPSYQKVMRYCFPKIDHIVAGSVQTEHEVRTRFPELDPLRVVYGVRDTFYIEKNSAELRKQLCKELDLSDDFIAGKKLIVTTGRLVKRKGVNWFVREVMPKLAANQKDFVYLVAGNGPDKEQIQSAIDNNSLQNSVLLLGYISDTARNLLYNTADIFLMPNIAVPGDMEGFGLVALEASSCGTPVFASGIEGIVDAVADGKTGKLLRSENTMSFVDAITSELSKSDFERQKIRQYVLDNFSWMQTAEGYMKIFKSLTK